MSDLETQIRVRADTTDVESGMARAKKSIETLGGTTRRVASEMSTTTGKAARDLGAMGDGADLSAKKVERNTRTMSASLQKYLIELETGGRQSRQFWEQMASVKGVNTAALKPLLDQLDQIGAKSDKASSALDDLGMATRFAAGAFAALGISATVGELVKMADASTNIASRLRLVTDSTAELARVQVVLFQTAQASRVNFVELTSTYAQMARSTKELGVSQKDLLAVTKTISQAVTISGGSAQAAQAALTQLAQGFASGALRGEELNSVLEQTPRLAMAIAQGLGVGIGELRKMGQEGALTASKVLDALKNAAAQVQTEFSQMTLTVEQASVQAENSLQRLVGVLDKISGASSAVAGFIGRISSGMDALATDIERIASAKGFSDVWFLLFNNTKSLNGELKIARENLADADAKLRKMPSSIYLQANFAEAKREVADLEARVIRLKQIAEGSSGPSDPRDQSGFTPRSVSYSNYARVTKEIDGYTQATERLTKAERRSAEIKKANSDADEQRKKVMGDVNQLKRIDAALSTQLANIDEKFKERNSGAGEKKLANAYRSLTDQIQERIAATQLEIDGGNKLSESQKLRIKFEQDLKGELAGLTAAERDSLSALLDRWAGLEKTNDALQSRVKLEAELKRQSEATIDAAWKSAEGISAAADAQELANATFGRGKSAMAEAVLEQMKLNLAQADASDNVLPGYISALQAAIDQQQRLVSGMKIGEQNDIGGAALKELQDFLDPTKAEDFGDALRTAFEGASDALGGMSGAVNKAVAAIDRYGKRSAQVAKQEQNAATALATGRMKSWDFQDSVGKLNAEREANNQQALRDTLGIFGDLTNAASQYFDKQSSGYKTLQTVSAVFHAAQLAMTTMELVPKAISAVLGQAQGEPYSAFARMAAMVAFVGSLGVSLGAGGGGGGGGGGYTGIAAGGTGTVLGMEGEQSESINNAIEILADNSKIELAYTQKMLSELTKVREGIQGLAGTASTDFFIRGFAGASFGDDFLDSGIGFFPGQKVADIIEKGVQGVGFNLIFSNGAQAMWKALDEEFTTGVGRVLANVAETVFTAADALGLNDAALAERMLSLIPTLGDTSTYGMNGITAQGGGLVSLKDMSGEEIQKELEAIFSAVGDQMAAAALPALRPFQQIGEGMFETLIRVTTGIETAQYALEQFGLQAIDYSDIVRKNGDIAVEIMRQTIMGVEEELANYRFGSAGTVVSAATPQSGLSEIIDTFVGDASELQELYGALLDVRGAMKSIGAQALDLSRDMIRGAGGLEALQSGLDSYLTEFFSEQEQVDAAWARMAEQFDRLGVAMPDTNDQFRAMVESLDTSTAAGANLFGGMMSLADAFADVTGRTDGLAEAARQAAEEQTRAAEEAAEAARKAAEEAAQAEIDRLAAIEKATRDSWAKVLGAFDSISAEFLDSGQLRQYRAERIRGQLAETGLDISVDDILGANKDQFAAAFKYLFELGTDEGRNQAGALAGVWKAFQQLLPVEESLAEVTKKLEEAFQSAVSAADGAYAALQRSVEAEKARITEVYNAQVAAVQAQNQLATDAAQDRLSAITEIFSGIDSAIKSTRIESEALSLERRRAAQSVLQGALAYSNAGGSLTNYQGLQGALDVFSGPSADLYATFEEYSREQAAAGLVMSELRDRAESQVSVAEMTLEAITMAGEEQLKQLKLQYDADIEALDLTLEYWREQLDAVKGVDNRVKSVADAVTLMGRSISAAIAAQTLMLAAQNSVDGSHASGLSYVPFDGYRAELHKGETVLNAQQANLYRAGALGGSATSDPAVQGLLRDIAAKLHTLEQQADGTRKASERTANTLENCDVGGGFQVLTPAQVRQGAAA